MASSRCRSGFVHTWFNSTPNAQTAARQERISFDGNAFSSASDEDFSVFSNLSRTSTSCMEA